jgi:aspartate/methionine/tyrosine aminotransferase
MWRLNDLFGAIPAHRAERLSVVALRHLEKIAARAKALPETNRALLDAFLESRADLQTAKPFGTIVFPRPLGGSVERLCTLLRERYQTTVVPGRFFEMPEHFRLGFGGETAKLAEGLKRLGSALSEL